MSKVNTDCPNVEYTLVLRPLKSDVPPIIRLRRALKALLRSYGLRCVDHRMTPTTPIQLGHRGPNATPTLSDAAPSTANSTPEAESCSSVPTTQKEKVPNE